MTNEAEKESVELASLDHSIYWLKAVIEQGARVFDAEAQPTKHFQSAQYNNRQNMEEQFFSHCVWKGSTLDRPHDFTDTGSDTIHGVEGEHHEGP